MNIETASRYCRCGSAAAGPKLTHERHKVPKADLDDLSPALVRLLAKLVPKDLELYAAAIDRFAADQKKVDRAHGTGAGGCPDVPSRLRAGLRKTLCRGVTNGTDHCVLPKESDVFAPDRRRNRAAARSRRGARGAGDPLAWRRKGGRVRVSRDADGRPRRKPA